MKQLSTRDWKNLIKDIQKGRCILLIGPLLPTIKKKNNRWVPIHRELAKKLSKDLKNDNISYDKEYEDDLEYISERYLKLENISKVHLQEEVKEFYQTHTLESIPPIYLQLAEIPFRVILNTVPDDYMRRAIKEVRKEDPKFLFYNYDYHRKEKLFDDTNLVNGKSLIYNLKGHYEQEDSLVLTETQNITYIKGIVQNNPPIPLQVRNIFKPEKGSGPDFTYLFLGFDYDRWQFKVLLETLEVHATESKPYSPTHSSFQMKNRTLDYYSSRFKFNFIQDHVELFVKELVAKYHDSERLNAPANPPKKRIVLSVHPSEVEYAQKIEDACSQLVKNEEIELWHVGDILEGNISEQIQKKIAEADIILPLLSIDYLKDLEEEHTQILEKHKEYSVEVYPVLLKYSDWKESDFKDMPLIMEEEMPITDPQWGQDADFVFGKLLDAIKTKLR